jgi:hypothetical protein
MLLRVVTLLFAVSVGSLFAQSDVFVPNSATIDDILKWLQSSDPRMVAWGAYFAAENKVDVAMPSLQRLAEQWQVLPRDGRAHSLPWANEEQQQLNTMSAVLDALIQRNQMLSVETLRRLSANFPAQTSIFLARMPHDEALPLLWEMYRDKEGSHWQQQRVAASLMALHPPPGFVASLLADTKVTLTLEVLDPGENGIGRGEGTRDCGGMLQSESSTWPKTGKYFLWDNRYHDPSSVLLVEGDSPIFYTRGLAVTDNGGTQCTVMENLSPAIHRVLLAQMAGVPVKEMGWDTYEVWTVDYENDAQYLRKANEILAERERRFSATARIFLEKNLITPDEVARARPDLMVQTVDMRTKKNPALSPLIANESNIHQTDCSGQARITALCWM